MTLNKNEGLPVQQESPHITHKKIASHLGEASEAESDHQSVCEDR